MRFQYQSPLLVQLSLSFGAECQPGIRFFRFWGGDFGAQLGQIGAAAAGAPKSCQVPSAVPNCGNIFGDEARSKNKTTAKKINLNQKTQDTNLLPNSGADESQLATQHSTVWCHIRWIFHLVSGANSPPAAAGDLHHAALPNATPINSKKTPLLVPLFHASANWAQLKVENAPEQTQSGLGFFLCNLNIG